MSFRDCVDGLTRVIKKIPAFNQSNITFADYRVLNGGFEQAIVLCAGPFTSEEATMGSNGSFWIDWEISIELFVRYSSEPEVATNIALYRQSIIEEVTKYPYLNGTESVFNSHIVRGDRPTPVFDASGAGPYFWRQILTCKVREDLTITRLE